MATKDPPKDKTKSKPKAPAKPVADDGWGDLQAEPLPVPPADPDFDFPELDAVLTEEPDVVGESDTGSDLPTAVAAPDELPPEEWDNEEPVAEPAVAASLPTEHGSVLDDKASFAAEAQRLARAREWQSLAGLTSAALDHSPWAQQPETRVALLTDLARLFRDRLRDLPSAEDQFRRLLPLAPADPEPNRFLAQRYREREDWRALYDLRLGAIDATWNPEQRLEWTREAARIAVEQLHAEELAIAAWERLWRSGDAQKEASLALTESYRRAGEWDRLGEFLVKRADDLGGAECLLVLREAAEAFLTGDRNHDRATAVVERILETAPDDPVALLSLARVHARRHDWTALATLGTRPVDKAHVAAFLDVRRLAADALWAAGEHDRSMTVYDCVLAADSRDAEALRAKEEHLSRRGDTDGLVTLLDARAQETEDPTMRAKLLERAADLAARELGDLRRAAALLERRAAIDSVRGESLDRLAEIYESLGEQEPVRRVLEERLKLVRNPRDRIELLRKIGEHCAHRLNDDARAEGCWREILDVVPDERAVREELIALYRRRGDFEAVDRAWSAFAWRPLDDDSLVAIWRAAAVNLQENVDDAARTLRAWQRVLDLVPDDATARTATVAVQRALGDPALLADALEARSSTAGRDEQLELWLELGRLHAEARATGAALAAYERILRVEPTHAAALEAIARLYEPAQAGVTRGALEIAAAQSAPAERAAIVRRMLPLVAERDGLERFFTLRRLLGLGGVTLGLINELAAAATEAGAFGALAALYEEVVAATAEGAARAAHQQRLAALYEQKLNDPLRALLTLTTGRQRVPTTMDELAQILRLADATGRHEDAFAMLGVAASVEAPLELRRAAIRERQKLADGKLGDAARAFHQAAWLVRLDAGDRQAFADAERLAGAAKLWRDLDGLYAELWDRVDSVAERVELLRKRRDLRDGQLADALGALDFTILIYRLQPTNELQDELARRAEQLKAWARILPVVEGRIRQQPTAETLAWLAAAYEEKRDDSALAFSLYGDAFLAEPAAANVEAKLQALAAPSNRTLRFAHRLRQAAARTNDVIRAIELHGRAAALYGDTLGRHDLAVDVHRRILQLHSRALPSYEVAFAHLRDNGMWRELRDLIEQRVELDESGDRAAQRARRLEIARICSEELHDGEAALRTYATILDEQPDNEEALAGVRALTDGSMEPAIELERLRLELARAAGARRVDILLACAALQERELEDAAGALATLKQLVSESGPGGAGYEPLKRLLEKSGAHVEVIDLMDARAAVVTDKRERIELLRGAIAAAAVHPVVAERAEQLNQRLLALDPDDRRARARLLQFHRSAGRWAELAALIGEAIARFGDDASEERRLLVAERVRLFDRALDNAAEAEVLVKSELARTPNDEELLLWLAGHQLRRGDHAGYAATRQQQVRLLPPHLGALVLCHLAELAQEAGRVEDALGCYRAARTLDGDNRFAAEGLKALGRRTRNWRATAALLSDDDAVELGLPERAQRLVERGTGIEAKDGAGALDLYQRAIAVDPDSVAAWDGLARVRGKLGDAAGSYAAIRSALRALWRATSPDPQKLRDEARRFDTLATLAAAHEDAAAAGFYAERAHDIDPSLPSAALAVAGRVRNDGRADEAVNILSHVLEGRSELPAEQRVDANYRLGLLLAKGGELDRALGHFRDGLRVEPLHAGLLHAVADVLTQKKRVAAAIQHYTQALLLAHEPRRRAQLYARLGTLWEETLKSADDAGACYDLAVAHGIEEPEVMLRALAYYRRTGRQEAAGRMIDRLLPRATTPVALAALWTERGSLLAASDDPKAMEAFDMALSYDPTCRAAVDGLAELLERRGEWQQLIDLLEARIDSGSADERAACLRRLARIARRNQHDDAAAEIYLRRASALQPTPEDYDQLLEIVGDQEQRRTEREALLAERLALAGPFVPALTQAGIRLTAEDQRRWAWCVLSPLMMTIVQDSALKSLALDLRKEYEKADTLPLLTPELHRRVLPADVAPPLYDVLAELDALVSFGPSSIEAVASGRGTRVDTKTGLGKTFAAIAERLGLPDAILARVEDLSVPYRVLDDERPHVVARADFFAPLAPGEIHTLIALMLEQARPGARLVASLPPAEARRVLVALFAAVGRDVAETPEVTAYKERIVAAAGRERLDRWAAQLSAVDNLTERVPEALVEAARRVGLVAAGEVRSAAKLVTRLEEAQPRMPSTGTAEELEQFFANGVGARRLLAFALSPGFDALLSRTE